MLLNQRREKIYAMIREDGHAKVASLSKIFNVTEVTIRQDLEALELEGLVIREHGGAYLKDHDMNVRKFELLNKDNMMQKQLIARKAIEYIEDGDTIILDSGSTTTEIAKQISGYQNLTVITNALNIAIILGGQAGINVVVTGGEFKAPTISLTGQKAADFFQNIHVDKLFLATAGVAVKTGLTYPGISDICVKKAMIDSANTVFLVADSSKLGKKSFASLGSISIIDFLITDSDIKPEDIKWIKANNVEFIIAEL